MTKNVTSPRRNSPPGNKVALGRDLAEALAEVGLSKEVAKAWNRDLRAARKALKAPRRLRWST